MCFAVPVEPNQTQHTNTVKTNSRSEFVIYLWSQNTTQHTIQIGYLAICFPMCGVIQNIWRFNSL